MSDPTPVERARHALLLASTALNDEIRAYPTPISACDVQFNHLLGERRRVTAALSALEQPIFMVTPRSSAPEAGFESQ